MLDQVIVAAALNAPQLAELAADAVLSSAEEIGKRVATGMCDVVANRADELIAGAVSQVAGLAGGS